MPLGLCGRLCDGREKARLEAIDWGVGRIGESVVCVCETYLC